MGRAVGPPFCRDRTSEPAESKDMAPTLPARYCSSRVTGDASSGLRITGPDGSKLPASPVVRPMLGSDSAARAAETQKSLGPSVWPTALHASSTRSSVSASFGRSSRFRPRPLSDPLMYSPSASGVVGARRGRPDRAPAVGFAESPRKPRHAQLAESPQEEHEYNSRDPHS